MNPKNHYKKQLTVPQPEDDIIQQEFGGKLPRQSNDALDNLMVGDEVWYRTNNPHSQARWVKAIFSKKFSHNVFQIHVGNVAIMAHRSQLKRSKECPVWSLPNVIIRRLRDDELEGLEVGESTNVDEVMDEMQTDNDHEPVDTTPKGGTHSRKRKMPDTGTDAEGLRRSKRSRKTKRDKEYCYEF